MDSTSLLGNNSQAQPGTSNFRGSVFSGLGNLITLLPTGTVFLFRFLNPIVTNDGHCQTLHKYLTSILLALCAFNCCFATFTDSYTGSDGARHYGIVTTKGLWPSPASESVDLSVYRLRLEDFVHALFSLAVFAVLGLIDLNTVRCLYPELEAFQDVMLQVLPPLVGAISGTVFVLFPWKRRGIGYPLSTDTTSSRES